MNKIVFTEGYEARARDFFRQNPEFAGDYRKTLALLAANLKHPSLGLEKVQARGSVCYRVNLGRDLPCRLNFLAGKNSLFPVSLERTPD